jgi:hypothetical protein
LKATVQCEHILPCSLASNLNGSSCVANPLLYLFFPDLLCYVASSDAGVPAKPAFVAGGTCTDPTDPEYGVGDWKFANYW